MADRMIVISSVIFRFMILRFPLFYLHKRLEHLCHVQRIFLIFCCILTGTALSLRLVCLEGEAKIPFHVFGKVAKIAKAAKIVF